jgi:hypothetical protein
MAEVLRTHNNRPGIKIHDIADNCKLKVLTRGGLRNNRLLVLCGEGRAYLLTAVPSLYESAFTLWGQLASTSSNATIGDAST